MEELAKLVAGAEGKLAAHVWRAATAGNLGGWMVARALFFLTVLTGSVGTVGGTSPNGWNKFIPHGPNMPSGHDQWNEKLWPAEYPLSTNEMSILLPHLLKEGRGKVDTYFSRVYNPIWTNPDGFSWIEALTDESLVGLHVALTPTWSETAMFADYVLPMGHGPERHDTQSYEQYGGKWLGFRQPVRRVAMERLGQPVDDSRAANPGEVWEENEFWFELSWRIDPDGSLGIRKYFEAPDRPGEKVTVDDYYGWIFDNQVPGLPEKAASHGMTPLQYMRRYGVYELGHDMYRLDERSLTPAELDGAVADDDGVLRKPTTLDSTPPLVGEAGAVGVQLADGSKVAGWLTPSRRLELYSPTMVDFGWPEYATPGTSSHMCGPRHRPSVGRARPDADLPAADDDPHPIGQRQVPQRDLQHSPALDELRGCRAAGLRHGDLAQDQYRDRALRGPGLVDRGDPARGDRSLAPHGSLAQQRERRQSMGDGSRRRGRLPDGRWRLRYKDLVKPFESDDPDSSRITWDDPGVHQNLAFGVHPDPWSGMHCWHQKVPVEHVAPDDQYGDVVVDTGKSTEVFREWLAKTRPGPSASGMRRPEFLMRPVKPVRRAFYADVHDVSRSRSSPGLTLDRAAARVGVVVAAGHRCGADPVSSAGLGLVERGVGARHQQVDRLARPPLRQTYRDVLTHGNSRAQTLQHRHRVDRVAPGERDGELLTAPTDEQVVWTHQVTPRLAECLEQ